MLSSTIFAVAAALSATQAQAITSTITMTQTLTITECNPTATKCLAETYTTSMTSTSAYAIPSYPAASSNTTSVAPFPTGGNNPHTAIGTVTYPAHTSATTAAGTSPVTAGAGSLVAQTGLLLGAVGAGIVLLA